MFARGEIWAYPTDTSFGLGARCDDPEALERLKVIKNRPDEKYFSLMVRDFKMLKEYAEVPKELGPNWFAKKPRTAVLKPTEKLPKSPFWPEKVAFRVCTLPAVAQHIDVPVTATSANISGGSPAFQVPAIFETFGTEVQIYAEAHTLPAKSPSEIWDYTLARPERIR